MKTVLQSVAFVTLAVLLSGSFSKKTGFKKYLRSMAVPYDSPDPEDETTACKTMKNNKEASFKIDLENELQYKDMLKLIIWNLKYNLKSGQKKFKFAKDTDWKREILAAIVKVMTKGCPTEYVPAGYLNVVQELGMIYHNSLPEKYDNLLKWEKVLASLKTCGNNVKTLKVVSRGLEIESLAVKRPDGVTENIELYPPQEYADYIENQDIILDSIWWMFSFAFGTCYHPAVSRSNWATQFKKLFQEDFMAPLQERWMRAGSLANFGPIIGNFDIKTTLMNLRYCVTAAYTRSGIADRQLVRPVLITSADAGMDKSQNKKTGRALFSSDSKR